MKTSDISIKKITAEATYPVRQLVLRPGRPLEEVHFEGDSLETTMHLGAYIEKQLVGVASFMKTRNNEFPGMLQYQLRGMAVLPEAQQQGLGEKLLKYGEGFLKDGGDAEVLWFNARETAVGFYRKFGYNTMGGFFEIPNVCTHILMYKSLVT